MRISDWSSDVCSSDLGEGRKGDRHAAEADRDRLRLPAGLRTFAFVDGQPSQPMVLREGQERLIGGKSFDPHALQQKVHALVGQRHANMRGALFRQDEGAQAPQRRHQREQPRSEEHTSELQSLMRISYAVFCLKKTKNYTYQDKSVN